MRPYAWLAAKPSTGVIASIPHTGTWLPDAVRARLASDAMRALPMTDWHLHALYDFLPALGVPVLHATVSRFAVDLNRSATPLALYPGRVETGVVPQHTFQGDAVWREPPSERETAEWIARWHRPYHEQLTARITNLVERFGWVVLLDLHSVASAENRIHAALEDEIYLGDRDGASCSAAVTDAAAAAFAAQGFRVARNAPYKGGWITHHYGQIEGVEALQVEMVQRVYMDEGDPGSAPGSPRFVEAQRRLRAAFASIIASRSAASSGRSRR